MWIENLEYCCIFKGLTASTTADQQVTEVKKNAALLALGNHDFWEPYNTLESDGTTYNTAAK